MKTLSNIFRCTFCWGRQYWNLFYILFIFYYWQQVLFTLRGSSLLSPYNDAFVDIIDYEGSFQFSPETKFTSPLYVHITLAAETEAESQCFAQLLQC